MTLPGTVGDMDVAVELPWMGSQRVPGSVITASAGPTTALQNDDTG